MRTVTLEFLRHGTPHGHLLSPLARYMALCGNHEPADVSVPFDHSELVARLRALLYKDSDESRELQLAETARAMSNVLGAVPGLVAELADSGGAEEPGPTHLRIIFNANELALLPFELANAANAFPGAGQPLALQPQVPMCITREVRRPAGASLEWPRTPRVLFAASSAGGDIPFVIQKLRLEAAIEPWLFHYQDGDDAEKQKRIGEHLTILENVTVQGLLDACASGSYTHVHLLAHGVPINKDTGRRYGIALHSDIQNLPDIVDGARLATLLRPNRKGKIQNLVRPTVVTLAVCNAASTVADKANAGQAIGAGASIAHALHECGIPLVVASQFPLSFEGANTMVDVMYEGLLSGADPRLLLIDLRRQLRVRVHQNHDWASVVAYASFPANLDRQLAQVRFARASRSIEAALNHADRATMSMSKLLSKRKSTTDPTPTGTTQDREALLTKAREKLRQATDRMQSVLDSPFASKALVHGLLASAHKRKSEMFWRAATRPEYKDEAVTALERSRWHYRKSFDADRAEIWATVQAQVLAAALDGPDVLKPDETNLARLLSLADAHAEDKARRAWAHGNLLELRLLQVLIPAANPGMVQKWEDNADELVRAVGAEAAEVHSTRRQLSRWVEFFPGIRGEVATRKGQVLESSWQEASALAGEMFARLPEPPAFS